jgi:hypothetical protein
MSAPAMTVNWSMSLAPVERPYYDEEPEPVRCPSVWYLPAERDRAAFSLRCGMDAGHPGDAFDARHGNGLARWTDETAAESFAEYLASQGPRCTECERPAVIGGMCGYHSHVEMGRDEIETESEAA